MTLRYRYLIDKSLKELPDINSLAQKYSEADKDVLEFYLQIAKELLESAQTKVRRLLFDIHCRFAELNTYKLEFQVGTFSNSSEFKIQREVKATNLKEASDFAEITVNRFGESSGITLEKIYSHRDLVLWDCKAKDSYLRDMTNSEEEKKQPEEFKLKFGVITSEGESFVFF